MDPCQHRVHKLFPLGTCGRPNDLSEDQVIQPGGTPGFEAQLSLGQEMANPPSQRASYDEGPGIEGEGLHRFYPLEGGLQSIPS